MNHLNSITDIITKTSITGISSIAKHYHKLLMIVIESKSQFNGTA